MTDTKFNISEDLDLLTVSVSGEISAETIFPKIIPKPQQNKFHLALDNAGYVNSSGIQGWIAWIGGMQRNNPNLHFSLQMLPPNFARLAHHIRDFLPKNVIVNSFVAPYFCVSCSCSFKVIYKSGANWKLTWTPKELSNEISKVKCPTCESLAEIDTVAEAYEKFQPISK